MPSISRQPGGVATSGGVGTPTATTNNMLASVNDFLLVIDGHDINLPAGNDRDLIWMLPSNLDWAALSFSLIPNGAETVDRGPTLGDGSQKFPLGGQDVAVLRYDAASTSWKVHSAHTGVSTGADTFAAIKTAP